MKNLILNIARKRPADVVIWKEGKIYLNRWHVIPRNKLFNIYLHWFMNSDDDRALHDHPWANISWLLKGNYLEHSQTANGRQTIQKRSAGDIIIRTSGKQSHRIALYNGPVWTLFITGPTYRKWGFYCPSGWKPFDEFLKGYSKHNPGEGCD